MKSYCVKEKKQTECVEPSGYMTAKNGRKMFWCTCASCGIKKTRFVKQSGKLSAPSQAGGERASRRLQRAPTKGGEMSLSDLAGYAGKAGKKAAEMGRFFASEWLREPGAQEMLVRKVNPFLKKGINQLSTAIRPKKPYKTNRKDLDGRGASLGASLPGAGIFSSALYGFNYAPWTLPKRGKGVDIHKAIGKLPKPKGGWTLPGHNYTGPYNPLEQQLRYDPATGEILEYYVKPSGKTDAVAAQHDVDYSLCGNDRRCKNKADRKMVAALDAIPWKERQWGHALARNTINVKQKLGLGSGKNGKRF